ncbi:7tm 6 domain containing protein [Asbolus verrucosus]|uniref:7tm 6 domain containing protein n=1 Tax=Asbolus verrucosus TaxID=1661398 RepID=A0A482VEJ5_ASBVE|nr:7tm 6 domain containing protein [Asbolus verrucosus]
MVLQVDLLQAFKPNMLLLKMVGLWNFDKEFFFKFYKYFITCIMVVDHSSIVAFIVAHIRKIEEAEHLYIIPAFTESLIKTIMFRKNFGKIKETWEILQRHEVQPKNENQKKILENSIILSRVVHYGFTILVFFLCVTTALLPLLTVEKNPPGNLWLPFDYHIPGLFELVYVYVTIMLMYYANVNVSTDVLFSISMIQIGAQCDILYDTLRNIDETARAENKSMNEILFQCVEHYRLISKYAQLIAAAYKEIMMVQFVFSVLLICATLYAQSLSERLLYATFESKWYSTSTTFKQNLMIFMQQLQNPIVIYAWNIFPINLEVFKGFCLT